MEELAASLRFQKEMVGSTMHRAALEAPERSPLSPSLGTDYMIAGKALRSSLGSKQVTERQAAPKSSQHAASNLSVLVHQTVSVEGGNGELGRAECWAQREDAIESDRRDTLNEGNVLLRDAGIAVHSGEADGGARSAEHSQYPTYAEDSKVTSYFLVVRGLTPICSCR